MALVALPVVFLAGVVALYAAESVRVAAHAKRSSDASATAGARQLIGDELLMARLCADTDGLSTASIPASRDAAILYAQYNPIRGAVYAPDRNDPNLATADLVLGRVETFGIGATFTPADLNVASDLQGLNAVQSRIRIEGANAPRTFSVSHELTSTSVAVFDDRTVGFRPFLPSQVLPVVPIGIEASVWNTQLSCGVPGTLPQIAIKLVRCPNGGVQPTAVPLAIGVTTMADYLGQISNGITKPQYTAFGQPLELHPITSTLDLPAEDCYSPSTADLVSALGLIGNQPRVWPLVQAAPGGSGQATVSGFVGARIISVNAGIEPDPATMGMTNVETVVVILQPAMVDAPTAVSRPTAPHNTYIGRVRLTR